MDNPRVCPSCASSDWDDFVVISTGRIMTSDQRIVHGELYKTICQGCGAVANGRRLSNAELERLYGDEYVLNTLGREEHQFFTRDGAVPRSQVFFEWIRPHLQNGFKTLLEIGCGEGNVLQRFAHAYPGSTVLGLEGSYRACELARQKGLSVERNLILEEKELPAADVIVAIGVLEHVEACRPFLAAIRSALNDNGRVVFALPVQDYPGYDLFFAEHVWHFTVQQCQAALARNGFRTIFVDANHPLNHGMGLFVCQKAPCVESSPEPDAASVSRNRDTWLRVFSKVDEWLSSKEGKRVAVFGASEVATLLMTFSALGDWDIPACIDEDPSRQGTRKHGVEVVPPEWLADGGAEAVLLAINPKYHRIVAEKLKKYGVEIYSYAGMEDQR